MNTIQELNEDLRRIRKQELKLLKRVLGNQAQVYEGSLVLPIIETEQKNKRLKWQK